MKEIIEKFNKVKILIIGDVMLDKYTYGTVNRISPEAPIPIVKFEKSIMRPGGAGNTAYNIKSLNGNVNIIGVIGDDDSGIILASLIDYFNIDHNIIIDPFWSTITKNRIIAHNQQIVRIDTEPQHKICTTDEQKIIFDIINNYEDVDVVVISDYDKGTITDDILDVIKLHFKNKPIIIDPKRKNWIKYSGATIITPNMKELFLATESIDIDSLNYLTGTCDIKNILITRGENGMTLLRRDKERLDFPPTAKRLFDVSGAGDTVVAVLALAIGAGAEIEQAVELSNMAAGLVVEKRGTAAITQEELKEEIYYDKNN